MKTFEEQINDLIEGIKIGYGSDDTHWGSIEATVRVLEFVRTLGPDLVGLSEEDFEGLILKAIKGDINENL
ncbi:hypothetical protein ST201phi2-1p085 [Pseudomonas phage 201phi2-1]|uniref:Uncharacterized protein n=1 Tax=Pseudomonas phage 201phi2-1 TaxID=198110 RepID=B3FK60_BP201|nr:hypothetical protein ST201phi2-1p085 [Pseudomonas phage 201phi2-1]ABY62918.1 hypothetical protein 201phi2-1p085 [Pseudomonas phage 201phi2-1]